MKKFILTANTIDFYGIELYQIKALKDFNDVKAGDLGGYVEVEENLSHDGDCWIYDEAKALHDARALEDATMRDTAVASHNANLYGNSKMLDNSKMLGEAALFNNATMTDSSIAFDFSELSGNALISGGAILGGNASSTKKVLYITTELYDVTISDNHIDLGLSQYTKKDWFNFTSEEILKLEGKEGLDWWKKWNPILIAMIED